MTHPELVRRYRRVQELHRSILPAGHDTAIRQIEAIDPHGILSLAMQLGEVDSAEVLRSAASVSPASSGRGCDG